MAPFNDSSCQTFEVPVDYDRPRPFLTKDGRRFLRHMTRCWHRYSPAPRLDPSRDPLPQGTHRVRLVHKHFDPEQLIKKERIIMESQFKAYLRAWIAERPLAFCVHQEMVALAEAFDPETLWRRGGILGEDASPQIVGLGDAVRDPRSKGTEDCFWYPMIETLTKRNPRTEKERRVTGLSASSRQIVMRHPYMQGFLFVDTTSLPR